MLTEEEREVREHVRAFSDTEVIPIMAECWEKGEFPFHLVPKLTELGICGDTVEGYGCAGLSAVGAGLAAMELARGDGSIYTFFGATSGFAINTIHALGSEEQKEKWLPGMARLEKLGAFALTEPEHGSDVVMLETTAQREGDEYILRARGRMKQVAFHGEHLQLTREITAKLGENRFTIHDVVENLAGRPEAHMILYHFNVGFPLLDEGSFLDVQVNRTDGLDERGQAVAERARQVQGPVDGYQEEVVVHDVVPDEDGWVTARMVNPAFQRGHGLALSVRYRKNELPYLWQWRNFKERAYVMGIEPGNADMRGRAYNRERGTLPILEPGERREYTLEVEATIGPR